MFGLYIMRRESDSYDPQFDEEMQALQRMRSANHQPIKKDVVSNFDVRIHMIEGHSGRVGEDEERSPLEGDAGYNGGRGGD